MAGPGRLTPRAAALLEEVRGSLPDGPLAVALSGGADSAVCAWAARAAGAPVRAITVDHGLPASADLVEAAAAVAAALGIPHVVVPAAAAGTSEGDLREARYAALEAAAAPGETLVSGHTADDQAETVLGNLVRGAGAAGIAGIPPRRGRWCRPLLAATRAGVRAVAADLGLPFADDPDNRDPSIRRSRIRTEVIPHLEGLNPGVRAALVRAGALAAADDEALERRAAAIPVVPVFGEVRIPAAALATSPRAVGSRAARRGLRLVLAPYAGDLGDVEAVLAVAAGAPPASLSGGWIASREGPWAVIHAAAPPAPPEPVPLPVPGEARFGRWAVSAVPVAAAPAPPTSRRVLALAGEGPLVVRAAGTGATVEIGTGSKPLAEALREAGVPARLRSVWPVVEQAGRMVWLAGARHVPGAAAAPGEPATLLRMGEAT